MPSFDTAAFIIDINSFDKMDRQDATAFAASLGDSITQLRKKKIPIIWVSIAPGGNKTIAPSNATDNRPFNPAILTEMGFGEGNEKQSNNDIYINFRNEFGPRQNEVINRKAVQDALLHPDDVKILGSAYRKEILGQVGIKPTSESQDRLEFAKLFNGPTLADYIRRMGYNKGLVLGAIDNHCCAETGVSAAAKGLDTVILTDRVIGWDRPDHQLTTPEEVSAATAVWQNPQFPVDHEARIKEKINLFLSDPARPYTPEQRARIENIGLMNFDDAMDGFVSQEFDIDNLRQAGGLKFRGIQPSPRVLGKT